MTAATVSYDLDRLRAALGWRGAERVDAVERRHLHTYQQAVGAEPAEVAPPTFTACFLDEPPPLAAATAYGSGWLNGGDRFECLRDVRVGDQLRSSTRLVDVAEKHGHSGRMAVLTFVTDFVDSDGRVAVRHTGTRIRR
jgi:hypothetical protein